MNQVAGASRAGDGVAILIPVYNDWPACQLLLPLVDEALAGSARTARVVLIDDGSSQGPPADFPGRGFRAIRRVDVLHLRRNLGHQRAIAIGLAHAWEHVPCDALVLMDSDGEDDPADVPRLLARFDDEGGSKIIFAERTRRSESWSFVLFYRLYKLLHLVLVGIRVRVGNFSVLPRRALDSLIVVSELWNHYSAAVFKSRQPFDTVPTTRARRLSGKSAMNFVGLVAHGLGAVSVFGEIIGVRLLVATFGLIVLTSAGLLATLAIRLWTDLPIPGWATSTLGILTILLFQAVLLSIQFSFIILGGRQGTTFLPCRDYAYFVGSCRKVYPAEPAPALARTAEAKSSPAPAPHLPLRSDHGH